MTNVKTIKARWTTALKSGVNATRIVSDAIEHTQQHGDTSLLSTMLFQSDKAGMQAYGTRLRTIVKAVYPAAKIKRNKDGQYSITRGDEYDEQSATALHACAFEGYSLIGPKLGEVFGVQKETKTVDEQLEARALAAAKWINAQEGVGLEMFISKLREAHKVATALKIKNAA